MRSIGVFSDPRLHGDELAGPSFAEHGSPVFSGHWAALMVSADMTAERKEAFADAFAQCVADTPIAEDADASAPGWRPLTRAEMAEVVATQRRCLSEIQPASQSPGMPAGKLVGLVVAIVGLAAFPLLMPLFGYVATAFLYVLCLMLLLWPRLSATRAATSVVASGVLAGGTYLLFTKVFSVMLPTASILEGFGP